MKAKSSELRRNYYFPRDLARMVGCPEKQIREYCKQGKIRGAKKTPGGQWRIKKPLSQEARMFLAPRALLAWIGKGEGVEEFDDSDEAQSLTEAILYRTDECIPPHDEVDVGPANSAAVVRIQELISEEIKKGKSLSSLILKGWTYQFWRKFQRCPSVSKVAQLMGISRSEFYRRGHSRGEIRRAYGVFEPSGTELPSSVPADFGDDGDLDPSDQHLEDEHGSSTAPNNTF